LIPVVIIDRVTKNTIHSHACAAAIAIAILLLLVIFFWMMNKMMIHISD